MHTLAAALPTEGDSPTIPGDFKAVAIWTLFALPPNAQALCRVRNRGSYRMSLHTTNRPARRRTFTPYVLLYLLAAGLALAYLTFLGVRPDLVALWRAKPNNTEAALAETQRNVERALSDIDPLKQSVGEVKQDVATVKVGLEEAAQRDRDIMEKVETLERVAAQASEKVAAAPAQPAATATQAPAAKKPAPAAKAAAKAPDAAHKGIETGSIEQKAAAAAAAKPAQPPAVGILLATGPSLDSLRLSWNILNDRHADAVRTLQARYVVSGKDKERTYGLVAGPLQTVADAKAVCKMMVDRGEQCEVSQFRGNAF